MKFEPNRPHHIYNRGNNGQTVFFNERNYKFFLGKVKKEWLPYCRMKNYAVMPNHFHFLCIPTEEACEPIVIGGQTSFLQVLSKKIGHTLSSYTKAINIERNRTGSLFEKKTRCIPLNLAPIESADPLHSYEACARHIEMNPVTAGLVKRTQDWPYSSVLDRAGLLVPIPIFSSGDLSRLTSGEITNKIRPDYKT